MYILGVSYGYTATVALLKDGKIVACASEERFNGIKNFNGFPKNAIDYCLKQANITSADLDLVTTPYLFLPPSHLPTNLKPLSKTISSGSDGFIDKLRTSFRWLRYKFPFLRPIGVYMYRIAVLILSANYTDKQRKQIASYLRISEEKVKSYEHHLCHAATAYYASDLNKDKALVLTLDGEGDNYCASVSIIKNRNIKVVAKTPREFSLGYVFGHVTKFLGMKPHEHEYKVMGLAPYAKDEMVQKVYELIKDTIYLDPKNKLKFSMPFNSQDYHFFLKENLSGIRFDYIAGAFQKLVEEKIKDWVLEAIKKTKIDKVVISGGVFMNIKANQILTELKQIKKIFIMPSCADESAPIGSCYLGYLELSNNKNNITKLESINDIYWGPSVVDFDELTYVKHKKYLVERHKNIEKIIAKLLAKGEIVANMSGRMEWGARALGNRSILANPKNPEVIKVINEMVKNRDFWMPFAPSILLERMTDYLINPRGLISDYMMVGFNSTKKARKEMKAALHPYDDTLRPQIVRKEFNPRYHKIIKEFEKLTGIGGVLNTSFNLHGYPIVLGPKEALHVFANSGLKYLAIENYLIKKRG